MDRKPVMDAGTIEALVSGRCGDPFAVLGPHDGPGGPTIHAFLPGACHVDVLARDTHQALGALRELHPAGVFAGPTSKQRPYLLRIDWGRDTQETEDPYSFGPLLGDLDLHLIAEGTHQDLAACLGAIPMTIGNVPGVRFAVWAPNAQRVSVVGDFNQWDGRRHPMRRRHGAGVWEIFIPRLIAGAPYKYELVGPSGEVLPLKADPVARASEAPPATASVIADAGPFHWTDSDWCRSRGDRQSVAAPISAYEVHATSWMRRQSDGRSSFDWDALADRLVPYVADMGFTHLELMPIMNHPFAGSWGYQPIGNFSPLGSMGTPVGLARLVDRCHEAGVGVLLDWVPGHFPNDAHGLARFDGTALYEHEDPREGFHRDWNTLIYNYGRHEVRAFLIASALHWIEHYHVDGLRVDAVASMLYRDYSRPPGEWVPNIYGGRENLEAIGFLRQLNQTIAQRCPGAIMIAEESTAWPGVTRAVDEGGLGFTYKWNMGWMHDSLHYMARDPAYRRYHHDEFTFSAVYAFSERYVLPLSHDEVVHGKRSLLGRMPGDAWQRLANLRAYLAFMWAHPGKKLLFMGGEFGQEREWNHDTELDWHLLDNPAHRGLQRLVRDLNTIYRREPALHRRDGEPESFRWIVVDDRSQSVFAFLRYGTETDRAILCVCNLTPVPRHGYRLGVPSPGVWREIVNSDAAIYGGSNVGNDGLVIADGAASHGFPVSLTLTLPPLATLLLRQGD
ncbi:MAG TPA: 1,4-alpha-glucan branching protein GlgB [Vineibacter sp.]|nr:1,4-alpha-glucan branching protein GlgB [Vineibacter sp.]